MKEILTKIKSILKKKDDDTLTRMSIWAYKAFEHQPDVEYQNITKKDKTKQVQLGCFLEEIHETLSTLEFTGRLKYDGDVTLRHVKSLSESLKHIDSPVVVFPEMDQPESRMELLDGLADVIQTACSVGISNSLNVPEAAKRVIDSNESKNGEDDIPLFDINGKIRKGPNYFPPSLEDLI